jgi:pyruvate dehydrogenase E2 component (dihydrolipoamide acetyltransferase)
MAKVTMPKAGQTMEEATILQWRKREGDPVARGEMLLDIDTDKASIEVEAAETGVLRKILCPEGTTVPVLAPIAIIAAAGDDISEEQRQAEEELRFAMSGAGAKPAAAEEKLRLADGARPETGRLPASPAARKRAAELGVTLAAVGGGSGPGGRILSSDVVAVAQARPEPVPARAGPKEAGESPRRPLSGMRRAIARAMFASKQSIPHFYMKLTIDAGALYAFYRAEKAKYACTINDIVTLACARVIRDFPAFRSRIEDDLVVEYPAASIGVAVGMDEGLVVPVVVGADAMSLPQLAVETQRLIEAAHNGKVVAMGQGVFTVSNLGAFGIEEFTAIINPPESGILAVGALRESVIVRNEGIRPGRVMTMMLSADHRLIDGLMAARFLHRLKELLEAPGQLATHEDRRPDTAP